MQVHTFKKARAAVSPSAVQHGIVWFWPNTDPQFKDIFTKKRPPRIPELDDLSYTKSMGARDFPFGYVEIQLSTSSIILFFQTEIFQREEKRVGGCRKPSDACRSHEM